MSIGSVFRGLTKLFSAQDRRAATGSEARYLPASEAPQQQAPQQQAPAAHTMVLHRPPANNPSSSRCGRDGVQTVRGWLSPFDVFVAHKMGMRLDAIRSLWGEKAARWAVVGR
jgi:hypothetical protein